MALEFSRTLVDNWTRAITCTAINTAKKELFLGSDDSLIRVWDMENEKVVNTYQGHNSNVTAMIYSSDYRMLFSAGIDGQIIAWNSIGKIVGSVQLKTPIYSIAYCPKWNQIIVGLSARVRVFQLVPSERVVISNEVFEKKSFTSSAHEDLVRNVATCDGKLVSAGFDRRLIIYNSPHPGDPKLKVIKQIENAHEAAITCLLYVKDGEACWLITGSFDCCVKVWSIDGNMIHRFDRFIEVITSVAYSYCTKTVWVTASSTTPSIFDPLSGINVTEYLAPDHKLEQYLTEQKANIKSFTYIPDQKMMIGITSVRTVIQWKYNEFSCVSVMRGHHDNIDCLAYTNSEPIQIFSSGGADGVFIWEKHQLSSFLYNFTVMPSIASAKQPGADTDKLTEKEENDPNFLKLKSSINKVPLNERFEAQIKLHKTVREHLSIWRMRWGILAYHPNQMQSTLNLKQLGAIKKNSGESNPSSAKSSKNDLGGRMAWQNAMNYQARLMRKTTEHDFKNRERLLARDAKKNGIILNLKDRSFLNEKNKMSPERNISLASMVSCTIVEEIGCFIGGYTYGWIGIWLRDGGPHLEPKCAYRLHKDVVTCVLHVEALGKHWLITSGWDQKMIFWDLQKFQYWDILRVNGTRIEEQCADGAVLDMDYSPALNRFAYASSDGCIYVREFDPQCRGDCMQLKNVMQGHESDVNCIRWNGTYSCWVSAGEDGTIRMWDGECGIQLKFFDNGSPVWCMCIDLLNGAIVTGAQDCVIRVWDSERDQNEALVQTSLGHQNGIRAIIHIPVEKQYISSAWDKTVRVWHAYLKPGQEKPSRHKQVAQPVVKLAAFMQSVVGDTSRPIPRLRPESSSSSSTENINPSVGEAFERENLENEIHDTFTKIHEVTQGGQLPDIVA